MIKIDKEFNTRIFFSLVSGMIIGVLIQVILEASFAFSLFFDSLIAGLIGVYLLVDEYSLLMEIKDWAGDFFEDVEEKMGGWTE